jgi:LAO/AO transport system kinase
VRGLRDRGDTVAVIAVDPSSRASGGALLGDRLRIATDPGDAGVFVRSMAARDRLGGLAEAAFPAVVLMRARFDWVLVETVGVGQSETEIADCADFVALCVQPGSGDAVQFMKAGVMEVPDLVLVTKGDLGAPARRTEAELRRALALAPGGMSPAVAVVSALEGGGVAAVLDLLAARSHAASDLDPRREAQGRAWIRARLTESFGRVGAAALAPRLVDRDSPFEPLATLSQRAREALYECLKRV